MQPHQDHRHLFAGGVPVRGEGGGGSAVHQPQIIGHGDISGIGVHIFEGTGQFLRQTGQRAVAKSAYQHDGQFLAGDGVGGTEIVLLAGDGSVGVCGL